VNFKVIWVVVTILGLIPVAALAAWLSTGSPGDQATAPEPEAVEPEVVQPPEPEFPNLTDGPRPPGQWEWSDLRGGECLRTFDSAFEETYDVVACDGEHAARICPGRRSGSESRCPVPRACMGAAGGRGSLRIMATLGPERRWEV